MLLAALGLVLFTVLRSPLKDDIAWLLYVARRWLTGRELYVDLVEVNPPLIVWISAIPIKLGAWLELDTQFVAMPFFVAIVLGCAWWTATLLRPAGALFADRIPVFAVLSIVLLIVPGDDLGQREHLLTAAFLPYLVLFVRTLDHERPALTASIVAGVLAGLGCALKPRYAGVFVVLELVAITRGITPRRALPVAAGAALAGYAGLVLLLCPAYMTRAVPMALALYGATDVSFSRLLLESGPLLLGEAIAIFLACLVGRGQRRNLLTTLLIFAVVSTLVCFIDSKDWFYHRLPATIGTILALLCWTVSALTAVQARKPREYVPVLAATLAMACFMAGAYQRLEPAVALAVQPERSAVAKLERLIRKEHARTYVAFSEWLALGFPVVNSTGVSWASRFDSMWALKGELWRARFDANTSAEWPVSRWVAHDFIAGCPDLAVVDTRQGLNYIAVLSASDPAFARAWTQYRKIAAFDGLEVFRRASGGCINPWIAAEPKVAALDRGRSAK